MRDGRDLDNGRIADPWGDRTPFDAATDWPARVDRHLSVAEEEVDRWVTSACVLCSNGCGVELAVRDGALVGIRGRAEDHTNRGRLGPKGLFGWQANGARDRLEHPLIRRDGRLVRAEWDVAMETVVERAKHLLAQSGPGAIGVYNTGQLFLEDYYALAMIAKAGIGTPHCDGNTRLCTATADYALKETFGCDGQPGSYDDVDHCDTLFLVGHNVAETQTVLWMRMLDRLEGPHPPRLVVIDPRATVPASRADVHLAPTPGTNLALLNALVHELIEHDWVDTGFVDDRTIGFDAIERTVARYTPDFSAGICGVPAADIRTAARILGESRALLSTVLQGVYQSHQATASAIQVNNINLLRGMIGRPGASVLQMNGQPTSQNTRETGCNGDLTGFRNWANEAHVEELAEIWNVEPEQIPHWAPSTHAMQIFRYAEEGSLKLLWIIGTNPAVSLPELDRIRRILARESLFVVVQDAFMTETAALADVVLPSAIWAEKTGTFTNTDRTVHLSEKAIEPPGEVKPDFDIFLDFGSRMGFTDKDGAPLLPFADPEGAFEAWKIASKGRPCDYSGLSYARLRQRNGIQWPCNERNPEGGERLYTDLVFPTDPTYCEDYGHDVVTGAARSDVEYKAMIPAGRAILIPAEYAEPREVPSADRPLQYTTGRTVYHFHTRTKTGRAPELQAAAPSMWVEMSQADAGELGLSDGDLVRVESERGAIEAPVRLTGSRPGVVFAPFHYGYWDVTDDAVPDGRRRAANELTMTVWDPVSKQPLLKSAAVSVTKVEGAEEEEGS
jgi:ferredoxin-nitrate reductase